MVVAVDGRHLAADRGVARYSRRLCAALAARGDGDGATIRALVPGRSPVAPIAGVTLVRTRARGRVLHGLAATVGRPTVAALCGGADVVWLPAPAPVAPGAPYVLSIHDLSWIERPGDFTGYERLWHRLIGLRRLARGAAALVCDTGSVADAVAERFGVSRPVVVEPGVDAVVADAALGPRPWPRPYVLYVGAREPRKGLDVLADAWPRAGLDADLLIVGSGRIAVPGAWMLGPVDDGRLAALYRHALALVLPSHLEGYGLPPREAAAYGVPSVVSDLPSLRLPGTLRAAPGDADALARALAALPAERERLAAELAPPRSWETAAAELATVLAGAAR